MTFAMIWGLIGDYTIAAALGAVVSSGEIVARYRDEPWDTLRSLPAVFYMLINALASMGALTIVRTFNINFGANETNTPLIQVIVAGLGAMMVFRSAFFTMRVGDQDVAVGAVSFLQVMLDAVDREVDRRRAILRADRVRRIMKGIAFDKALTALPTYSIALMQNMEDDDQKKLLDDLTRLSAFPNFDDGVKAQILGLAVMNYLGEDVLQASVDALRARINLPSEPDQPLIDAPSTGLTLNKILDRIRSEGAAGRSTSAPEEASPNIPEAVVAAAAASNGGGSATVSASSGANGNTHPREAAGAPSVAPPPAVVSAPSSGPSLDLDRLLQRVREKTSASEAPTTSLETATPPPGDSLPVDKHTTISLPINDPV
jgi:hypothetical protein